MASAALSPVVVRFGLEDPAPVVEAVSRLIAAGEGWANLTPDLGDEVVQRAATQRPSWFSGRGPLLPVATFVAGRVRRDGRREPAQAGLEHGAGPRALRRLIDGGLVLPPGWSAAADHPRRGIVVRVAVDSPAVVIVEWLLAAASQLARRTESLPPLGAAWRAEIWEPRRR